MKDSFVNIQADIERWRFFSGRLVDVRSKEDGRVIILEVQSVCNNGVFTRGIQHFRDSGLIVGILQEL